MRFRAFLAMWSVLALVVGITVLASGRLDDGGSAADQVVGGAGGQRDGEQSPVDAGAIRIEGTITALRLHGAVPEPRLLATPLTVDAERGFGNGATVTQAVVDGGSSSIVWDGGRPFALSGAGGIVPDPVLAELAPGGLRFVLGGANHHLVPGRYRLDTPVAVGATGVATPRDSVAFDATADTRLEARGNASLLVALTEARRLRGPGRVEIEGALTLTDSSGTRQSTTLVMDHAAFDLTVGDDGAGTITISGLVGSAPAD